MKMIAGKVLLSFSLIVLVGLSVFGDTPTSLEQIPVYIGMAFVNGEKIPESDNLIFGVSRTYEINAPIEDVVAFYEKELDITKRFEQASDPHDLSVGGWVIKTCVGPEGIEDTQKRQGKALDAKRGLYVVLP